MTEAIHMRGYVVALSIRDVASPIRSLLRLVNMVATASIVYVTFPMRMSAPTAPREHRHVFESLGRHLPRDAEGRTTTDSR